MVNPQDATADGSDPQPETAAADASQAAGAAAGGSSSAADAGAGTDSASPAAGAGGSRSGAATGADSAGAVAAADQQESQQQDMDVDLEPQEPAVVQGAAAVEGAAGVPVEPGGNGAAADDAGGGTAGSNEKAAQAVQDAVVPEAAADAGRDQRKLSPAQPEADSAATAAAVDDVCPSKDAAADRQDQQQQQKAPAPASTPAAAGPEPEPAAAAPSSRAAVVAVAGGAGAGQGAQPHWERLQQQLGALQGAGAPVDASVINNAVLSVSDALELPDDLLAELPNRLLQTLHAGTAGSNAKAGGSGVAAPQGLETAANGDMGVSGAVLAALQGWYQRLCGAVAARDGQQVTQLVMQLGQEVLVAGQ